MVVLLAGGLLHCFPGPGIARHQRLPLVERLGRDLARVVDPHQARGVAALTFVQLVVRDVAGGVLRAGAGIRSRRTAEHAVERDDEAVRLTDVAIEGFGHRVRPA